MGKADIIATANGIKVHSVNDSLPLPSILRLNKYIRLKRREVPLSKANIMRRDNYTCQYCGKRNVAMTLDHVLPRMLGGKDSWENLVCACADCNSKKGNRTPAAAKMPLLRKPRKPHYFTFVLNSVGNPPKEWRPFLFMS